jgi:hypothetical protein
MSRTCTANMRNIPQFAISVILLASQVHIPTLGNGTAEAESQAPASGVYEVTLNTKSASPIDIVGPAQPNYDTDVLAPLKAAQAKEAAEAAAAAAAAAAKQRLVRSIAPVLVAGSHTDWMSEAGIPAADFGYVDYIISHESGWDPVKWNYSGTGAYGLGQALPASKMAAFGADYMTDPVTQLKWANAYACGRYGSWANAYAHWLDHRSW